LPTAPKKKAIVKRIKEWSFSRWQEYMSCPFKAYCKVILKLGKFDSKSPALVAGNRAHSLAEAYVSGKVPELGYKEEPRSKAFTAWLTKAAKGTLPEELSCFTEEFAVLRAKKYKTEEQWCFKSDWSQTRFDDWGNVWHRMKIDTHNVEGTHGVMVDYKTGKKYPEKHDLSLDDYALGMFLMYPQLETVMAVLWYLDIGEESEPRHFTRADVPKLKKYWEKATFKMLNDERFIPKPSNFECRYCDFSKAKGGPCKH
jgi:hypothetical protein